MSWFGATGEALAQRLALPRVEALEAVDSTMDEAHRLADAGAGAGTLVLAESQRAGRGRGGHRWSSDGRRGIWMTLLERPRDASGLDVLSLRVGLGLASVLDRWTETAVQLKWPNDLLVDGRKLAGVLIEVRWRDQRPEWVAIGVGLNLALPADQPTATSLAAGADPVEVLGEMVPALRAAAFATGPLRDAELRAYAARDAAAGRALEGPARGIARGVTADGALLVESEGRLAQHRAGSLVFAA